MALRDPPLLFGDCQVGEQLRAPDWSWWNIQYAAEDVGDLEANETEGHVCKACAFFRDSSHIRL